MIRMTLREAIERFGADLILAATGAIEKKGRAGEVRVVFDAFNGVLINMSIRVRDQIKFPAASDARVALREIAKEGGTSGRSSTTSRRRTDVCRSMRPTGAAKPAKCVARRPPRSRTGGG